MRHSETLVLHAQRLWVQTLAFENDVVPSIHVDFGVFTGFGVKMGTQHGHYKDCRLH